MLLPFLVGGCREVTSEDANCLDVLVYGLVGTARDAITGAEITSGSYLVAREAGYVDSVTTAGNMLLAAPERAGTYDVTIGRDGYSPSSLSGVVVDRNQCHVIPVFLVGSLLRNP